MDDEALVFVDWSEVDALPDLACDRGSDLVWTQVFAFDKREFHNVISPHDLR